MREYTFKPAPVRKAQTWAIKDDHLMRRGGAEALSLAAVTSASWNTVTYRGTRSAWLHLKSEQGVIKIECNDHGGGRDEFFALIQAVLADLARLQPDLEIEHGYSAPWRLALFILGIAGTLMGGFLIYVGITDMTGRGSVEASIAGLALVILMFPVAWTCRPNVKARTVPPLDLAREIASYGGAPVADPERGSSDA
ncbi:MAG: hypothetical protein HRT82_00390 [Henriciella sp.]|nr:hypothetical protein [Henriciella sp.]